MCLSCGCNLPANSHGDKRTITYTDYQKGDRDYREAGLYENIGAAKAKINTNNTLSLIKRGKLSPTKK